MHTLKGTAATIGAVGLAELAGAAEQAIAHNATADALEALLPPVDTACQTLVAALQSALPPEADTPGTAGAARTPLDGAQARALVERLGALLEDSDSDAIELFKHRARLLAEALGKSYSIRELSVSTGSRMPPPMLRSAKSMIAESASMPMETGESLVTVSVSGKIEVK